MPVQSLLRAVRSGRRRWLETRRLPDQLLGHRGSNRIRARRRTGRSSRTGTRRHRRHRRRRQRRIELRRFPDERGRLRRFGFRGSRRCGRVAFETVALARCALRDLCGCSRSCRLRGRRGRILRIDRDDGDLRRRCARFRYRRCFLADDRNGGDRCRGGAHARGGCRHGCRCGRRDSRQFLRGIGGRCRRRDGALHRVIVVRGPRVRGRRGNRRGRITDAGIFDRAMIRAQEHYVGRAGCGYQEPTGNHHGLADTRHACSPIISTRTSHHTRPSAVDPA